MSRETFIDNTFRLIKASQTARKIADLVGSPIDCEGLIGDLIDGYGSLILYTAYGTDGLPDQLFDDFWNGLIYENITRLDIEDFYDKWFSEKDD